MNIKKTLGIGGLAVLGGLVLRSIRGKKTVQGYNVEDYIFGSRMDAEDTLVTLSEKAVAFGDVSVGEYYEMIDIATRFKDCIHGWTPATLSRAVVIKNEHGYSIKFPPAEEFKL